MLPQCPALAEKWKRGPRQRPEGRVVAAQSVLTAVQIQQARQTAATLPSSCSLAAPTGSGTVPTGHLVKASSCTKLCH